MRLASPVVFLTLLLACGGDRTPRPAPSAPVGKVVDVKGDVTVSRGGGSPEKVAVGLDVYRDMTFKTGAEAAVTVRLWNNYTWTLDGDREEKVATISVLDRDLVAAAQASGGGEATAAAGRQGEREAGESGSTVAMPAPAPADSPAPPALATATPTTPPVAAAPAATRAPVLAPPAPTARAAAPPPAPPPPPPMIPPAPRKEAAAAPPAPPRVTTAVPRGAMKGALDGLDDEVVKRPGGPSATTSAGPEAGGKPSLPAIRAAMTAAGADVLACLPAETAKLTVYVVFDKAGKVVEVNPTDVEGAAAECVKTRLKRVTIPAWEGDATTARVPFVYSR